MVFYVKEHAQKKLTYWHDNDSKLWRYYINEVRTYYNYSEDI